MKTLILHHNNLPNVSGMKMGIYQAEERLARIKFPIEVSYALTGKNFTGERYSNVNTVAVNPTEILQEVRGNFKIACLIYDWDKVFPKPTNPAHHNYLLKGCTPIQIPMQFYTDTTVTPAITYTEALCLFFLHELSHSIAFLTGQKDKTHDQGSSPEWANKHPTDYYIHLINELKPFWHLLEDKPVAPPSMPIVTLTRRWDNGVQTLGELTTEGFNCKTLERPWRNNKNNISCIPKGEYLVKWTWSPKFMRYTYELQRVPNRTGIRIHKGNYFFSVEGCILLGDKYGDLNGDPNADILNSTATIKKFEEVMGKRDFLLRVI